MLVFVGPLLGLPLPLQPFQILWLNLVTNGGQDVALAFEKREPGLLDRPPRRPSEPIFDRVMIRQTAISGLYMGVVAYGFFAWAIAQGIEEAAARDLLLFLMNNPGRAWTRDQLIEKVWGKTFDGDARTVDLHVARLRSKIEDDPADPRYVETVWGVGYRFQDEL